MLRASVVIIAIFAVLAALGGRAEVGVLSGTLHSTGGALLGLAYVATYLAALLIAPPLFLAGLAERAMKRRVVS